MHPDTPCFTLVPPSLSRAPHARVADAADGLCSLTILTGRTIAGGLCSRGAADPYLLSPAHGLCSRGWAPDPYYAEACAAHPITIRRLQTVITIRVCNRLQTLIVIICRTYMYTVTYIPPDSSDDPSKIFSERILGISFKEKKIRDHVMCISDWYRPRPISSKCEGGPHGGDAGQWRLHQLTARAW